MGGRFRGRSPLTHFDEGGAARMAEVGPKAETARVATATARVEMQAETAALIAAGEVGKGDVLGIARVAGIQAVKRTAELIPLCHPLRVTGVDVDVAVTESPPEVRVAATVRAYDRTGVEMEALSAASVAALTVYDMCKAADRGMRITDLQLERKSGGKSGDWRRA